MKMKRELFLIEAFAHNYKLQESSLSNHGEVKIANHFLPKLEYNSPAFNTIPLLVQLTFLECGGMILGCSISQASLNLKADIASTEVPNPTRVEACRLSHGNVPRSRRHHH
ncbi:hypothetical protein HAX54_042643 [Datura stramonium]|uniref:Uncharacterized protein n=1 Tax=Datura stramonium TaxID=4076 RepID=A0ABS8SMK0_DATST|nr:hypothetical protein [Datura stramonium]